MVDIDEKFQLFQEVFSKSMFKQEIAKTKSIEELKRENTLKRKCDKSDTIHIQLAAERERLKNKWRNRAIRYETQIIIPITPSREDNKFDGRHCSDTIPAYVSHGMLMLMILNSLRVFVFSI